MVAPTPAHFLGFLELDELIRSAARWRSMNCMMYCVSSAAGRLTTEMGYIEVSQLDGDGSVLYWQMYLYTDRWVDSRENSLSDRKYSLRENALVVEQAIRNRLTESGFGVREARFERPSGYSPTLGEAPDFLTRDEATGWRSHA